MTNIEKNNALSEKEKMLLGQLYNPSDTLLVEERQRAKELIFDFNHTHPSKIHKKEALLKQLICTQGNFYIEPPFYCDYGYNIDIGENFYANTGCVILDVNSVKIGKNVLLAPNVQIYTAEHPLAPQTRLSGMESAKPVVIKDNVWIGGGSIICPGVTIGNNVTIGAGSVVVKDIPDNVIAVGNPCKVLRTINDTDDMNK